MYLPGGPPGEQATACLRLCEVMCINRIKRSGEVRRKGKQKEVDVKLAELLSETQAEPGMSFNSHAIGPRPGCSKPEIRGRCTCRARLHWRPLLLQTTRMTDDNRMVRWVV
jgi:hypothetical protein